MSYDEVDIYINIQLMMQKFNTQMQKARTTISNLRKRVKELEGGGRGSIRGLNSSLKKFRMEMFAVVYGGQLLVSMFDSMLKPGEDALGMSERWSQTMLVLMLPALIQLYPAFDAVNNAIMGLSTESQTVIGWLTLLGSGLGGVAINVAILGLAMSSMTGMTIPALWAAYSSMIIPILAVVAGAFLIVVGVLQILHGKMEGIGLVIMGVSLILLAFGLWWALIPLVIGAAVYLIIKYWDNIKDAFETVWRGIHNFFANIWNGILSGMEKGINWILGKLKTIASVMNKVFGTSWDLSKFNAISLSAAKMDLIKDPIVAKFAASATANEVGSAAIGKGTTVVNNTTVNAPYSSIDSFKKIIEDYNNKMSMENRRNTTGLSGGS